MTGSIQSKLREIPSVDSLLKEDALKRSMDRYPRSMILESIRYVLEKTRQAILHDEPPFDRKPLTLSAIVEAVLDHAEQASQYKLQEVVNATGIIIHTNLGRSVLSPYALERLLCVCSHYNNLEYDIEAGERGSRYVHAESLLRELTGAEAALVVNNNAGAVLLVLNTLAAGREVIVSRGQLVEIGGSFRIPDVMRSSGAALREVGCTNRTHISDYEAAVTERTALLLKVHMSNYRIMGFTADVSGKDLSALGKRHGIPVMEDLGSGCFVDLSPFGLKGEPTVQEVVRSGVDVITFSGDKLLGGPQAGIIVGKSSIIAACRKNPLTRALRVGKMTLSVLESTLRLYRDQSVALENIPTLRMISTPRSILEERAHSLASVLRSADCHGHFSVGVHEAFSQVGGGALPDQNLPTYVVSLQSHKMSTAKIEAAFRRNRPAVIGRIESDQFLMDVRTIVSEDCNIIGKAFQSVVLEAERL